jgi:cytochrome c peroxidase
MKSVRRKSYLNALLVGMMSFLFTVIPLSGISAPLKIPFENPDAINADIISDKLDQIVKNDDWLLVLGRAAFWDQNMGSDGGSCASCHFSAGADNRMTGQMNPAFRAAGGADTEFGCVEGTLCEDNPGSTGSGGQAGPEYTFVEADYPFRQLESFPNAEGRMVQSDRNAELLINTNDVHSSAGSFDAEFIGAYHGQEKCGKPNKDIFYKSDRRGNTLAARAVEPRNTPTTINSGMLFTNFWDGRANNLFNGVGVFGMSDIIHDPTKRLIKMDGYQASLTHIELPNAALASLSVGPILDNLEMSCDGRTFADVARKVLYTRPLSKQRIAKTDSTFGIHGKFGDIRAKKGRGLKFKYSYYKLIQLAFKDDWWKAKGLWKIQDNGPDQEASLKRTKDYRDGHTQMEINFPMFWGLALQKYQHSLVSDKSRFDIAEEAGCFVPGARIPGAGPPRFEPGPNLPGCYSNNLWSPEEEAGRTGFAANGCVACHGGNMFTNAAMDNDGSYDVFTLLGFGPPTAPSILVDNGFQNTGANVLDQDLGRYAEDAYGIPLSWTMQIAKGMKIDPQADLCNTNPVGPNAGTEPFCNSDGSLKEDRGSRTLPNGTVIPFPVLTSELLGQIVEVGGAMKSPSLRNVGLTPPYFHYGGYSNLHDVLDFYNRGGSHRDIPENCIPRGPQANCKGDTSGSGPEGKHSYEDTLALRAAGEDVGSNVAGAVSGPPPGRMTDETMDNMVKFMLSLSDDRVMCDAGPFDHPELIIFKGAKARDRNHDYRADDRKIRLPAVGMEGYKYSRPELCIPNKGNTFAEGMGNRLKDKRPLTTRGPNVPE